MTGRKVGVIGLGLIGGSLALGLRDAGIDVIVWDTDPDTRKRAAIDGLTVSEDVTGPARADMVFIAVPLRVVDETFEAIAGVVGPHAVVSDVGSVKAEVHRAASRAGLGARFVGAHPMAGTEHVGYEHAETYLLTRVRWAVTVSDEVDAEAVRSVIELLTRRLEAHVVITTPELHDEVVAKISHVPHLLASVLVHAASEPGAGPAALQLAAGSFRDGTRVVSSSSDRSAAMVWANSQGTAIALDTVIAQLNKVRDWLLQREAGAEETQAAREARQNLDTWFAEAVAVRSEWGSLPAAASVPRAVRVDWADPNWRSLLLDVTDARLITGITAGGKLTNLNRPVISNSFGYSHGGV